MQALTSWGVELELSGVGGGWTDVTADVMIGQTPLTFSYGISGAGPLDRVADTGRCNFMLDNSAGNSGAKLGYYSPLHANARTGFTFGIAVRIKFAFGGVTYYKWRGKITKIAPLPGRYQDRLTAVDAVDWMDEAANFDVYEVGAQVGQRGDQIFSAVLSTMPKQPAATSIGVGPDILTYALDDVGDHPAAATVFQKIAQTGFDYVYIKGDTVQGGTLIYEPRNMRATLADAFTFSDNMIGVSPQSTLELVFNRVDTIVHPKRIDALPTTVLWMQTAAGSSIVIQPGQSVTIWADFHDPSQPIAQVGGANVQTPLTATTDYVMNSDPAGIGVDLTSSCSIVTTAFAATAKFVITNGHATLAGYMTTLQIRGEGIYDYTPVTSRSEDTVSQAANGIRPIVIEMPYQDNANNGQAAADLVKHLYGGGLQFCQALSFFASDTAALLTAALAREIGDRIGIAETLTGLASSGSKGHFVQSVAFSVEPSRIGPLVTCTWTFTPSDTGTYWVLDSPTQSQLDSTTILGYF